jgi:hypothetical protein
LCIHSIYDRIAPNGSQLPPSETRGNHFVAEIRFFACELGKYDCVVVVKGVAWGGKLWALDSTYKAAMAKQKVLRRL